MEEFRIPYDDVIAGFTDTLVASQKLLPMAESHTLEGMRTHLGLDLEPVTDAVDKAEDCRRVTKVLANHCRMKFLDFVIDPDWNCSVEQQWDFAFE